VEIIIEEVTRGHKLLGRHKFLTNKVSIGRGYQNDIILADPHVCPEHVIIEYVNEQWQVLDQQSVNGTFLNETKQTADQHIIHSGDIIQLGKSKIRVIFPSHPVEQSISFTPFEGLIDFVKQPLVLALNISFFAFVTGVMFYLNQAADVNISQYLVRAVGATIMFALWPGLVALISVLTKNDARIVAQLAISFVLFNLMWLSDVLENIIEFNVSSNWSIGWITSILPVVLAFALFWFNSYVGFQVSEKRRLVLASSLTALLFGGSFLVQLSNKPEFNYRPNYDATVMVPAFRFAPSSSIEKFARDSSTLFAKTENTIHTDK